MTTSWEDLDEDPDEDLEQYREWYRDWVAKAIQQQAKWHKRMGNEHDEEAEDG